jgi:hypothetical protein
MDRSGEVELDLSLSSHTTTELCAAALAYQHLDLRLIEVKGAAVDTRGFL